MGSTATTRLRKRGELRAECWRDLLVRRPLRAAFRMDGTALEDSLRLWGANRHVADDVPGRIEIQTPINVVDDEVVWGGYLSGHYGHFLTESVARLWPVLPGGTLAEHQVVFIAPSKRPSFVNDWLSAFGVRQWELSVDGMSRFRSMCVPEPAWRLNAWISPEIRDIHLYARRHMSVRAAQSCEVLWLSRSALEPGRVAHDERLLEWLLRDYVKLWCPEKSSLPDQIAVLENSEVVAGIVGSAFHTLLLLQSMPTCVYLCPSTVASAYPAQGELIGGKSTFMQALERMPCSAGKNVRFPASHRLMIPEVLRELVATVLPTLSGSREVAAILAQPPKAPKDDFLRYASREAVIAAVAHYPYSIVARKKLAEVFEAEGLSACANEQRRTAQCIAGVACD